MSVLQPLDMQENPSWVLELPDAHDLAPPVDTLEQELPFGKITWQNFERLCLRLAASDGDVEYCRLYGTEGQEQGGIDRRRSTTKYATWQSKRHKSFSPGQIETAVTDFPGHSTSIDPAEAATAKRDRGQWTGQRGPQTSEQPSERGHTSSS
jgi:hypothetical protein